jgi:hypothetical protein
MFNANWKLEKAMGQSDMRVSAAVCREQEALQRQIAASDSLESRRNIASVAAAAWAVKALAAEKREAGHLDPIDKLDADITREFADEAEAESQAGKD